MLYVLLYFSQKYQTNFNSEIKNMHFIDEVYWRHYIYEFLYYYYTSRQKNKHRFIDPCTKFSEVMDYPQKKAN